MSEIKLISPMLDDFIVGNAFSEHDGVRCYPAMKRNSDTRYILKVISIPASQVRLDALLLSGAYKNEEEAGTYFAQLAQDVKNELDILNRLADMDGFLSYDACQIVPKDGAAGYDVYLLGKYRRSLERHFRKYPTTHLAAVNLGLDMCACLTVCRQAGFLYADLKPGNIFISNENQYRIGDLGFLPIITLKYASLPDRYRSPYTPPELNDPMAPISSSIDIYAAGLILYQAYNGGTLPFQGRAPIEPLPPPLYADYEMAEIILKACAPDPADRWEDPIKMGQALVSYMQRNTVNDTPIIPPLADISDEDEQATFEPEPSECEEPEVLFEQADEAGQMMIEQMLDFSVTVPEELPEPAADVSTDEAPEEDIANLSFLDELTNDETAPQADTAEKISYNELSDDACGILEQADDLIAHEPPAPAVAPEPIDVPIPEIPSAVEEEPSTTSDEDNAPLSDDFVDETVAAISEAVALTEEPIADVPPEDFETEEDATSTTEDGKDSDEFYFDEEESKKKHTGKRIVATILALVILACITVFGYIFYRDYYIKTIDDLQIHGIDDQLTVSVSTKADHSLLTVVCTDSYGNKTTAPVENGFASFSDLVPDSLYTITVDISGFHGLRGEIRGTYTTAPQTQIVSFNAVTGAEAGTVIVSFTIKGHDSDQWTAVCESAGESTITSTFSGHLATITGLTVGKTYTITLDSADNGYVVGTNQLQHTASQLLYPKDLDIQSFDEKGLVITWGDPEGTDVAQWTVLCYNDSGYNQTLTTTDNTATFTDVDPTGSYTVEVTASGMSVGGRLYISKNAVTVTALNTATDKGSLNISWTHNGSQSASWILTYTINNGSTETVVPTTGTTGRIEAIVPGATYRLKLQLQDGTTVISGIHTVAIPEAKAFNGYGATKDGMTWQMCLAPEGNDWSWWNVQSYQTKFTAGQRVGFVARLANRYAISYDIINVVYVVRDEQGQIISVTPAPQTWSSMWYQHYGEFNVPSLPQSAGTYTLDIYFNGESVHQQIFTIS